MYCCLCAGSIDLLFNNQASLSNVYNSITLHFYAFFVQYLLSHPVTELVPKRYYLFTDVGSSLHRYVRVLFWHSSIVNNNFKPFCRLALLRNLGLLRIWSSILSSELLTWCAIPFNQYFISWGLLVNSSSNWLW